MFTLSCATIARDNLVAELFFFILACRPDIQQNRSMLARVNWRVKVDNQHPYRGASPLAKKAVARLLQISASALKR